MAFDYKKEYKEFYMPKNKPSIVTVLSESRKPQRVIVIRFPNRESLNACFSSEEYKAIEYERAESVDARAVIAEGI